MHPRLQSPARPSSSSAGPRQSPATDCRRHCWLSVAARKPAPHRVSPGGPCLIQEHLFLQNFLLHLDVLSTTLDVGSLSFRLCAYAKYTTSFHSSPTDKHARNYFPGRKEDKKKKTLLFETMVWASARNLERKVITHLHFSPKEHSRGYFLRGK